MYEEFYRAVERMYDKALDFLLTMDDQTIAEYRKVVAANLLPNEERTNTENV